MTDDWTIHDTDEAVARAEAERDRERDRYEQAMLWRGRTLPLLVDACDYLEEARDTCPISVERVKISKALAEAVSALRECSTNMSAAKAHLERLDAE